MSEQLTNTGPPARGRASAPGIAAQGTEGDDVNPAPASENAPSRLRRQGHTKSIALTPVEEALPGEVCAKLLAAAATRPSSELEQLLDKIERHINFHRGRILSLSAAKGAVEAELARRACTYGLQSIGAEVHR